MLKHLNSLREQLQSFGNDATSQQAIDDACRENGWFTRETILRAVGAICDQMLAPEKLQEWLAAYPTLPVAKSRRILVVMAGNIPLVGFFDLLCVLISGHRCAVKPSSKDQVLTRYIVDLLHNISPDIPIEIYDGQSSIDAVIATGSDNANRYFRTQYATIPSLLRGSRQSVAVLSGRETEAEWSALADDIWAYSGLGCRNVSLIFLPRGTALHLTMPPVCEKYRAGYRQARALLLLTQQPFIDLGAAIAVEQRAFPTALSRIAYSYYDSPEEVSEWLKAHDNELQCVVTQSISHSRQVPFGAAQSPALTDYPDERDVLAWLAEC